MLDPTELRLYKSESDVVRLAQGEGYVQVQRDGRVLILVDEAQRPARPRPVRVGGQAPPRRGGALQLRGGLEQREMAERDKRRAEAFLEIARAG